MQGIFRQKIASLTKKRYLCALKYLLFPLQYPTTLIHIDNTLVSEDLLDEAFCCDLALCKGACCFSEGESGAPLDAEELALLDEAVPVVWDDLTPRAQEVIRTQGPCFRDKAGDWVTSVVGGRDCVFCAWAPGGMCYCAIEKAWREGRFRWMKPVSCHLYPVRLKKIGDYTAVNYDRQDKMCGCARKLGRKLDVKVYQCLRDALVRKFGDNWYSQLENAAEAWKEMRF